MDWCIASAMTTFISITLLSGAWNNLDQFRQIVHDLVRQVGLDLQLVRKCARNSYRWMDAYRKGLDGAQAERAVRKYKSHRRIPENATLHLMSPNRFYDMS